MAYKKQLSSRISKNDRDKSPKGPAMGAGKVIMLEDCRQGDEVQIALWKGTDAETGEPSISVSISKKIDEAGAGREQRVAFPQPTLINSDDVPF